MSYDSDESGKETGRPIELFEFIRFGIQKAVFTSHDRAITLGRTPYQPIAIKAGNLVERPEEKNTLPITMPYSDPFFDDFQPTPHPDPLEVVVRRMHLGEEDEAQLWFKGKLVGTQITEGGTVAEMHFVDRAVDLVREIPRHSYGLMCEHELYGPGCKVNINDIAPNGRPFRIAAISVRASEENKITVPLAGFPNGWFTGGEIVWKRDRRMIAKHDADDLEFSVSFPKVIPAGESVDIRAGCGHTSDDCKQKFDKMINYGGFPFTPLIDPTLSILPED